MNKSIINKLLLARRLFAIAQEHLRSTNEINLSIGVNLLQDAVEAFLLSIAEHVNANIQSKTGFEQYIDIINEKISPKTLPFRARLLALNKLRVNSKHAGLSPAQSEVSGLAITIREFFDEVSISILGLPLSSVSLVDLLKDGEAKDLLKRAEESFSQDDYETCLFNCRKAIFLRIEDQYDISSIALEGDSNQLGLAFASIKAPAYTWNKNYIERHVKDATDYVVFDDSRLEIELITSGIDPVVFWNVWRLTPEVHRLNGTSPWIHKRDFVKLDEDGIRDRTEYVLDSTIGMLLALDQKRARQRWGEHRRYTAKLRGTNIPVYEKASSDSAIKLRIPEGIREVSVDFSVESFDGKQTFWRVYRYEDDLHISGYVLEENIGT